MKSNAVTSQTVVGSRLVFVGGVHRSGTSLVHTILRSHPAFSGFVDTGVYEDEGQHLQSVYPTAKAFGGPGEFGFAEGAYMDENHPLATPENARTLLDQWTPYWDVTKRYLLEKSPPNLIRTRFLQRLFPGAQFVMVLRHPIAVAYATKKWSRTGIPSLVEHTLVCYERFRADVPRLEQVHVIRYEELVSDRGRSLRALVDRIGADGGDLRPPAVMQGLNARYFARWSADRHSAVKGLLNKLRKADLSLAGFEERVNVFGYSVHDPEALLAIGWTSGDRNEQHHDG